MATDIVNIAAEAGRDIIDDDAEAALTITSTNASGTALKLAASTSGGKGLDVDITGTGAGLDVDVTGGGAAAELTSSTGKAVTAQGAAVSTFQSAATGAGALSVSHTSAILSSPTVAPLTIVSSTASGPLLEFGGVTLSVVSTASAGATVAYGVRVKVGNTYGWMPIYHTMDI